MSLMKLPKCNLELYLQFNVRYMLFLKTLFEGAYFAVNFRDNAIFFLHCTRTGVFQKYFPHFEYTLGRLLVQLR